jgi:hypothetical protein
MCNYIYPCMFCDIIVFKGAVVNMYMNYIELNKITN